MKTIFVESNQFNQMISYKPYAETKNEKRKVKYSLLDQIKDGIGDVWYRLKEGSRQAYDQICFFSAELGFFYAGDEYLAEQHEVSDRTIRRKLKELVELGQVVKVHRRSKKCNGRGKPIYLFVNHPYFKYWVEMLGINLNVHTDVQTENTETPCESKEEQPKKVPTYSLPKKQESNIYISDNSIMKAVYNRVNDAIKDGTTIQYISSYVNKVFKSLEQQALLEAHRQDKARREKRQEESRNALNPRKDVPFWNWLES
ncbi:DeoR family transcriptional regulator [Peribacillus loiseleuriae]|uniref:DeoR family transcriptional regulator n=1 Tax=Peribacillus loiseleuriae TaxID=1679170 RepID=UPI003D019C9E